MLVDLLSLNVVRETLALFGGLADLLAVCPWVQSCRMAHCRVLIFMSTVDVYLACI